MTDLSTLTSDQLAEKADRMRYTDPYTRIAAWEEAFGACASERDQAVRARDAMLASLEVEPPPPQIVDEIVKQMIGDLQAQLDQAVRERDEYERLLNEAREFQVDMATATDAAERRADRLAAALERYGGHDYDCGQGARTAHGGGVPTDCTCGLVDALAASEETPE